MPEYRRNRIPGVCYFFTVNLLDRNSDSLVAHIDLRRDAVRKLRMSRPFHIDAWVVLPEHMHAVWTLPRGDSDYSGRRRAIKTAFAKALPKTEWRSPTRIAKGERGIWQRRFWEHAIRDDDDYAAHVDYVHVNPLKHGLVDAIGNWPHSSFHRCVARGVYPADWGGADAIVVEHGERRAGLRG